MKLTKSQLEWQNSVFERRIVELQAANELYKKALELACEEVLQSSPDEHWVDVDGWQPTIVQSLAGGYMTTAALDATKEVKDVD